MDEQTFIDLICKSMQDSAREQLVMGRKPQSATREAAIKQVAMLQNAKQEWQANHY